MAEDGLTEIEIMKGGKNDIPYTHIFNINRFCDCLQLVAILHQERQQMAERAVALNNKADMENVFNLLNIFYLIMIIISGGILIWMHTKNGKRWLDGH